MLVIKAIFRGFWTKDSWVRVLDNIFMPLTSLSILIATYTDSTYLEKPEFRLLCYIVGALIFFPVWPILNAENAMPLATLLRMLKRAKRSYDEVYREVYNEHLSRKAQSGDISIVKDK